MKADRGRLREGGSPGKRVRGSGALGPRDVAGAAAACQTAAARKEGSCCGGWIDSEAMRISEYMDMYQTAGGG